MLTVEEAASRLRVSKKTIWRWLQNGRLIGTKPGGGRNSKWLIQEEVVERLAGVANTDPQGKEQGL